MPQSLSFILIHVVFSTKDRLPLLNNAVRPALHAYLATVARHAGCECFRAGGIEDHVHLAIRLSRTVTPAQLVEDLKTSSSKWIKTQSPNLAAFAWQRGYGAFSVGPTDLDAVCHYIDAQEAHHRTHTFQDEYRTFLTKYGIEFDERYVWDSLKNRTGFQPWVSFGASTWGIAPGWYRMSRWPVKRDHNFLISQSSNSV